MEGVMMRNAEKWAVAVRTADQQITVKTGIYKGVIPSKTVGKIPILRGVCSFIDSLYLGMKTLMFSADLFAEESEKELEERLQDEQKKAQKKADKLRAAGKEDQAERLMEETKKKAEEERMKNPFSKVDLSYLDDAVFIGDSRTETLRLYAGWDNVTYYSKTGTNIWAIMEEDLAKDPDSGEKITVEEALKKQRFGKIYIMLGINELGTGTPESFYQQFKSVVKQIRELQPDAILFVQSIIHVSKVQDGEGTVINNENVNARNKLLQKLADNKMIYYLDGNI